MSHWNKLHISKQKNSPQICKICTQPNFLFNQGTSFYTCKKASLTIEATIVIPLTIGFLSCILFFFRVIQVQAAVERALIDTGRVIAVESSIVDSEEVLFASAEALLLASLSDNSIVESYVENGALGIWLLESGFSENEVVLHAKYRVKLPVSFFEVDSISLVSKNSFRKWIGNRGGVTEGEGVYITPNGVVYHLKADCRSLDLSVKTATGPMIAEMRGKNGQKYYPCSRCVEDEIEVIYYTDYGTLYHADISCHGLKRTIQKVPKTEIGDRRPCSYCGSSEN